MSAGPCATLRTVGPRSYSDEQAAAIIAACVDRGMSMRAARVAAANGELDGLDRFDLSLSAVQRLVSRERMKRLEAEPFDVRSSKLAKRALAVAEREMTRIERQAKLTAKDRMALDRLGRLAANLRTKPWRDKSADDFDDDGNDRNSLVATLARQQVENGSATDKPEHAEAPAPSAPRVPTWVRDLKPQPVVSPEQRVQQVFEDLQRQTRDAAARDAARGPMPARDALAALAQQKEIVESPRSSTALRACQPRTPPSETVPGTTHRHSRVNGPGSGHNAHGDHQG
jgi:hypothetical protein